ncbi:MAG TPA: NUDIX hydrolase, partial [Rhodothermales bacterium]
TGRWIIPKGNIEPELTARESAAMEAYEEGGVKGHVHPSPIGIYLHGEEKKSVLVFLMDVRRELPDWPEAKERKRQWLPPADAIACVDEQDLKALISEALDRIGGANGVSSR